MLVFTVVVQVPEPPDGTARWNPGSDGLRSAPRSARNRNWAKLGYEWSIQTPWIHIASQVRQLETIYIGLRGPNDFLRSYVDPQGNPQNHTSQTIQPGGNNGINIVETLRSELTN